MPKFAGIVATTLPLQIADRIREAILDGQIKIDDQLPTEEVLAKRFGVSRATIREALKRLAAEKLVHSKRGPLGGTFLKRPDPVELGDTLSNSVRLLASLGEFDLDDIVDARFQLGRLCCELAARNGNEEHFKAMAEEVAIQRKPTLTDVDFCASDVRFHQALVGATGNSVLNFLLPALNSALQPVTNLLVYRFRERKVSSAQHERIMNALAEGNAEEAISVLREQCEYLRTKLAEARQWKLSRQKVG